MRHCLLDMASACLFTFYFLPTHCEFVKLFSASEPSHMLLSAKNVLPTQVLSHTFHKGHIPGEAFSDLFIRTPLLFTISFPHGTYHATSALCLIVYHVHFKVSYTRAMPGLLCSLPSIPCLARISICPDHRHPPFPHSECPPGWGWVTLILVLSCWFA